MSGDPGIIRTKKAQEDWEANYELSREIGDKMADRMKAEGIPVYVIYSSDPTDLDSRPIEGDIQVRMARSDYWGGEYGLDYESPITKGATLYDILKFVNEGIIKTKDHHHVFFEGMEISSGMDISDDLADVIIINPIMGS